jgi:hypothetical protein
MHKRNRIWQALPPPLYAFIDIATMADMDVDVDPVDTPATTSKSKATEKESKKRFEVKKVSTHAPLSLSLCARCCGNDDVCVMDL